MIIGPVVSGLPFQIDFATISGTVFIIFGSILALMHRSWKKAIKN